MKVGQNRRRGGRMRWGGEGVRGNIWRSNIVAG